MTQGSKNISSSCELHVTNTFHTNGGVGRLSVERETREYFRGDVSSILGLWIVGLQEKRNGHDETKFVRRE